MISSGLPMRPTGSWAMTRARPSGVPPEKRPVIGVSMMPGQIALILMPSEATSSAADLVMSMTPCLAAALPSDTSATTACVRRLLSRARRVVSWRSASPMETSATSAPALANARTSLRSSPEPKLRRHIIHGL